jgi:acid phosphatase (class A)
VIKATGMITAAVMLIATCASIDSPSVPNAKYIGSVGPLPGYLSKGEYPDSDALLPPPPEPGSTAHQLDEELNRQMLELRDTPRWDLAGEDAKIRFPEVVNGFACALGIPINEQDTPSVYILFRRLAVDIGMTVRTVKKHYHRQRPFLINEQPTCAPSAEKYMKKDGSYPSGHTAAGWAWGLMLTEIAPDRTDSVLARGWAYGHSRAVCNVHWHSDVTQGRLVGAAVIARLHSNDEFRADIERARGEIAISREKGLQPSRDCAAEAKVLANDLPAANPRNFPDST